MKIDLRFFENLFGIKASEKLKKLHKELNLDYEECTQEETEENIKKINETLNDDMIKVSGPHRIGDWTMGWHENFFAFSTTGVFDALKPRYFGKIPYTRFNNKFVKSKNPDFEYNCFKMLQACLFEKYVKEINSYYEFGCGTGYNLLNCEFISNPKKITGLDWAETSQMCITAMCDLKNKSFECKNFDFEKPDLSFDLDSDSVVTTLAALEQIGDRHGNFIDYLLSKKPSMCLHLEPIEEVLDQNIPMEDLSLKYFAKRKYLSKFLTRLRDLEAEGKIEILETKRTNIGSFYIEGYTLVAWRIK